MWIAETIRGVKAFDADVEAMPRGRRRLSLSPLAIRPRDTSALRGFPARGVWILRSTPAGTPPADQTAYRRLELRVFAGKLRCVALQTLLLPLESRFAGPTAIQIIPDLDGEPAHAVDFQFHGIAVLQRG